MVGCTAYMASDPRQTASMRILVSWIVCNDLSMFDDANHKPCISLSGMEASVLLILVFSANFDIVLMRLVRDLADLVSQDFR